MTQEIDLFRAFATDEVAEVKGAAVTIEGFGSRVWNIARSNNEEYNKLFMKLYAEKQAIIDDRSDEAAKARAEQAGKDVVLECWAKTILVGWEGEVTFNGEKLVYSPENAKKLLAVSELFRRFAAKANDFATYRIFKDDKEKN